MPSAPGVDSLRLGLRQVELRQRRDTADAGLVENMGRPSRRINDGHRPRSRAPTPPRPEKNSYGSDIAKKKRRLTP